MGFLDRIVKNDAMKRLVLLPTPDSLVSQHLHNTNFNLIVIPRRSTVWTFGL